MVDPDDGAPLESRPPRLEDLLKICAALNASGSKYIVIGGMAVIQAGFVRATEDVDLLIEASPENIENIRTALSVLPDRAVRDVRTDDVHRYVVVRVADEVVVDLMKSACGIEYAEASREIDLVDVRGVQIPFARPELLLRMKQTVRAKDALDRRFLEELLTQRRDV